MIFGDDAASVQGLGGWQLARGGKAAEGATRARGPGSSTRSPGRPLPARRCQCTGRQRPESHCAPPWAGPFKLGSRRDIPCSRTPGRPRARAAAWS
jgi:hypothetical protein